MENLYLPVSHLAAAIMCFYGALGVFFSATPYKTLSTGLVLAAIFGGLTILGSNGTLSSAASLSFAIFFLLISIGVSFSKHSVSETVAKLHSQYEKMKPKNRTLLLACPVIAAFEIILPGLGMTFGGFFIGTLAASAIIILAAFFAVTAYADRIQNKFNITYGLNEQ